MALHMGFIQSQKAQYVVLRDDRGDCVVALPGGEQRRSDPADLRRAGWRFTPVSTVGPAEAQVYKDWWLGRPTPALGAVAA